MICLVNAYSESISLCQIRHASEGVRSGGGNRNIFFRIDTSPNVNHYPGYSRLRKQSCHALTGGTLAIYRHRACAYVFSSTPANSFAKTPAAIAPSFVNGCLNA